MLIRIIHDVLYVFSAIWWVFHWILYIATFPLRLCVLFIIHFPIISIIILLLCLAFLYLFRRLTAINILHQITHNVLPYTAAFLYSMLTFFFPQINTVKRVVYFFLHPIRFLLDLLARVDQRAERVRNMVDAFRPSGTEQAIPSKWACVACRRNEKKCLLLPCSHLCLCSLCYDNLSSAARHYYCPICSVPVRDCITVKFS